MTLHWAKTIDDAEQTVCGETVGDVLTMTDDHVTTEEIEEFCLEPEACKSCKMELE